ncbi:Hypothetical predicted protein, partial [Marmota monax]
LHLGPGWDRVGISSLMCCVCPDCSLWNSATQNHIGRAVPQEEQRSPARRDILARIL